MLFERAGGGEGMPTRATGMGVLGMAVVVGLSAALQQREEQREANAVAAVVCTPIRPCCWHWPPFIGAAGGGSSAVDCVEGAIVMVVVEMGCRRRCSMQQREEQREANAVVAAVRTDLDVLLALASLHRHSWRRLFCRRLCGGDVEPSVRPGSYPAFLALSHVALPAPYIMSSLWQVCFQSAR